MKKIIFLACIFLQLTACKDDQFFQLQRPAVSPWTTIADFDRAPVGAYSRLFAGADDWSDMNSNWQLYKNAVGDDAAWSTPGDNAWGWYRDTENNKDLLDQVFTNDYAVISSVNDALQFAEANEGVPFPKITPDDQQYNLDRIVGELHFLRGYGYYIAATTYMNAYVPGGANDAKQLPLRTTKASSYEDASAPKIGTVQEIWDQIIADFSTAFDKLPQRYIAGKMNPGYQAGRANKFAAAAMLSRAYFAMGNYPKAKENASYVIDQNGGDYDLTEDPIQAFNKSVLGRGKEVIMYMPAYDRAKAYQHLMATTYTNLFQSAVCTWVATHMDYGTLNRIGWMSNAKTDTTINLAARRDKRFQQLMVVREAADIPVAQQIPGRIYETRVNLKWRTIVNNKYYRGPGAGYTNVPQIRLAEMYLTRSICSLKAGDKTSAAADLNIVRKRAWDAAVAGQSYEASPNFVTTANITEQMINDERLIEMFMEGDRIDYLRGLKVDVGNGERGPGSVPYTDKGFVWPVPLKEKTLNRSYNQ